MQIAQQTITNQVQEEDQNWTMDIKSNPGLLDIDLKELWRYRDLIGLIVRRDFVSAYKQTVLGPLLEPLALIAVAASPNDGGSVSR